MAPVATKKCSSTTKAETKSPHLPAGTQKDKTKKLIKDTANELRGPPARPGRRTQSRQQKLNNETADRLDQLAADLDSGKVDADTALDTFKQINRDYANASNEISQRLCDQYETAGDVARVTRDTAAVVGAVAAAPIAAGATGATGLALVATQATIAGGTAVASSMALDGVSIAASDDTHRKELIDEAFDPKRRLVQFTSAATGSGAVGGARLLASTGVNAFQSALIHGGAQSTASLINGVVDDGKLSKEDLAVAALSGVVGAGGAALPDTVKGNLANAALDGAAGLGEGYLLTGELNAETIAAGVIGSAGSLGFSRLAQPADVGGLAIPNEPGVIQLPSSGTESPTLKLGDSPEVQNAPIFPSSENAPFFDVWAHGDGGQVSLSADSPPMSAATLADAIRDSGQYDGQRIRLNVCDAGCSDLPNQLAHELGVDVLAPNGNLHATIEPDGTARLKITQPDGDVGHYRLFSADNDQPKVRGHGVEGHRPDTPDATQNYDYGRSWRKKAEKARNVETPDWMWNGHKPHGHHIIPKEDGKGWGGKLRELGRRNIPNFDVYNDPDNLTIAPNGDGIHTAEAYKAVYKMLKDVDGMGEQAFRDRLKLIGYAMMTGDFYDMF